MRALWTDEPEAAAGEIRIPSRPVSFAVRGKTFVYDPDDMRLFETGADDPQAILEELRTGYSRVPQFELHPVKPSMLVCVLTKACPLRCRYCFADPTAPDEAAVLSLAHARQALGLLSPSRPLSVSFFGGEPLMAWGRLTQVVAEAQGLAARSGRLPKLACTTNGVLLTPERAAYFARHGFSLIVSLDGPEELHDAARIFPDGRGSHAAVLRGLRCVAAYPELAARTTLRATYDGNAARLVDRLSYLNDLADDLGLGQVSVEPADVSEGCLTGARRVLPTDGLKEEYYDAARWVVRRLRDGKAARFHHLTLRIRRLQRRQPSPSECGAGVGYLSVAPDGSLHACHRLGGCGIGHAARGIDRRQQAAWTDNRYYARTGCADCVLRNICGGGCRRNSLAHGGDLREPEPWGCWLTRTCVEAAAWALAEIPSAVVETGNSLAASPREP